MLGTSLLVPVTGLRLIRVRAEWNTVELVMATATVGAMCPCCGTVSRRVHSRYVRQLQDAPLRRVQVSVELHVRKFYCDRMGCDRAIFTERVPGFVERYARRTVQLDEILRLTAFISGGEGGSRVAGEMRICISPQSLLRLIRKEGVERRVVSQVVGVDDWAFAKRRRYGAMIVDLEQHQVVDLLPDRLAGTVAEWLRTHPGIEIVTRDRGDNFVAGVTQGAPKAIQVADRWHLHHNLGELLKRLVESHFGDLRQLAKVLLQKPARQPPELTHEQSSLRFYKSVSADERQHSENQERYRQRHMQVHAVADADHSIREIARITGLARRTISTILSSKEFIGAPRRGRTSTQVDAYRDYIAERIEAGVPSVLHIMQEIKGKGYTGSYSPVLRLVRLLAKPHEQSGPPLARPMPMPIPSVYDIVQWLVGKRTALNAEQIHLLEQWLSTSPTMQEARTTAQTFTSVLTERQPTVLIEWLRTALASHTLPIRHFARSIQRDIDAVQAALSLPWSNAQLEGQINRLKLIKRQMYGRGKFDLLRIRVMTKV